LKISGRDCETKGSGEGLTNSQQPSSITFSIQEF